MACQQDLMFIGEWIEPTDLSGRAEPGVNDSVVHSKDNKSGIRPLQTYDSMPQDSHKYTRKSWDMTHWHTEHPITFDTNSARKPRSTQYTVAMQETRKNWEADQHIFTSPYFCTAGLGLSLLPENIKACIPYQQLHTRMPSLPIWPGIKRVPSKDIRVANVQVPTHSIAEEVFSLTVQRKSKTPENMTARQKVLPFNHQAALTQRLLMLMSRSTTLPEICPTFNYEKYRIGTLYQRLSHVMLVSPFSSSEVIDANDEPRREERPTPGNIQQRPTLPLDLSLTTHSQRLTSLLDNVFANIYTLPSANPPARNGIFRCIEAIGYLNGFPVYYREQQKFKCLSVGAPTVSRLKDYELRVKHGWQELALARFPALLVEDCYAEEERWYRLFIKRWWSYWLSNPGLATSFLPSPYINNEAPLRQRSIFDYHWSHIWSSWNDIWTTTESFCQYNLNVRDDMMQNTPYIPPPTSPRRAWFDDFLSEHPRPEHEPPVIPQFPPGELHVHENNHTQIQTNITAVPRPETQRQTSTSIFSQSLENETAPTTMTPIAAAAISSDTEMYDVDDRETPKTE